MIPHNMMHFLLLRRWQNLSMDPRYIHIIMIRVLYADDRVANGETRFLTLPMKCGFPQGSIIDPLYS